MVCQAMSIAITVVLPAPVASFSASRISSGLASLLALTGVRETPPRPCLTEMRSQLAKSPSQSPPPDKKWANAAKVVVSPVLKEPPGLRSYTPVAWIEQSSPLINVVPDRIYDRGVIILLLRG
jgi:hypothetical protein